LVQRVHIEYMGDSVELPPGETIVGRDTSCALRFNDPAVSRKHLRFIRRQNEVFVEDLGSSNGTLLNGRAVAAPLRIHDGDVITVGSRLLTVRVADRDGDDLPSTLVLRNMNTRDAKFTRADTSQLPITDITDIPLARTPTKPMPTTVPLPKAAHQRCPRCAEPVSESDEECPNCKFEWGSFRPMSRTDVRPNPLNRRRHDRAPIELHLVYSSEELEIEAMSRDLSESGVFVCSQVLDPIGTACELTILVDGGPPLGVKGVVRRVVERPINGDPIGLGVEFVDLADNQLAWIRTVIARLAQDEASAD
jgi:hypothetical protein